MKRWIRNLLIIALLAFPFAFIALDYLEDLTETGSGSPVEEIISSMLNLPQLVINLATVGGYTGIFALMLLEAAAFPVPSEIILPLAGYLVSRGVLGFWLVVAYSTVAAIVGSFIDFFLGWKLGSPFLSGEARLPYIDARHLQRTRGWFERYGPVAVALCRLVPAARVLISFPAGAYRMSKWKFVLYTTAGCLPWNITLVYLGWWLGSSWGEVVGAFRYINVVVYVLLILLVIWVGWRLTAKRKPSANSFISFLLGLCKVHPPDASSPSPCGAEIRPRKFSGYAAIRGSRFSLFLRRVMSRIVQTRLRLHSKLVRSRLVAKCAATSGL
jgi:membrane protein DedA with SNARE-associated domain